MKPGTLLIAAGIALVLIGLLWRAGLLSWFGHLPGDIRSGGERTSVYLPITSMLIVSVLGSIALNVIARFFRDP